MGPRADLEPSKLRQMSFPCPEPNNISSIIPTIVTYLLQYRGSFPLLKERRNCYELAVQIHYTFEAAEK
jgi:hypothetical protein